MTLPRANRSPTALGSRVETTTPTSASPEDALVAMAARPLLGRDGSSGARHSTETESRDGSSAALGSRQVLGDEREGEVRSRDGGSAAFGSRHTASQIEHASGSSARVVMSARSLSGRDPSSKVTRLPMLDCSTARLLDRLGVETSTGWGFCVGSPRRDGSSTAFGPRPHQADRTRVQPRARRSTRADRGSSLKQAIS